MKLKAVESLCVTKYTSHVRLCLEVNAELWSHRSRLLDFMIIMTSQV